MGQTASVIVWYGAKLEEDEHFDLIEKLSGEVEEHGEIKSMPLEGEREFFQLITTTEEVIVGLGVEAHTIDWDDGVVSWSVFAQEASAKLALLPCDKIATCLSAHGLIARPWVSTRYW